MTAKHALVQKFDYRKKCGRAAKLLYKRYLIILTSRPMAWEGLGGECRHAGGLNADWTGHAPR
ncbi:MAG: hypothetical protein KKF33_11405, partial [Alphaproteobacteria bacterium]|nr:hypothetical protein [Alphaproteobacteria bacterium]